MAEEGMNALRIEHMREFVTLATVLSYAQAAERLFISESTLSRHIASLEDALGAPLLVRDTHSVRLTSAGAVALDGFTQALERYDGCIREIGRLKNGQQGTLTVATAYYMTPKYLAPLMHTFQETYPQVDVALLNTTPYGALSEAAERTRDLALCASYRDDLSDIPEQLECIVLARERLSLLVPEKSPLASQQSVSLQDLNDLEIRWVEDPPFLDRLDGLLRKEHVIPQAIVKESYPESISYSLMEKGGVSFTVEGLASAGLVSRQLSERLYTCAVLCYHKQNANPVLQLFLDSLSLKPARRSKL